VTAVVAFIKPSHSLPHSLTNLEINVTLLIIRHFYTSQTGFKKRKKNEENLFLLDATKSNPENTAIELLQWTSLFSPF